MVVEELVSQPARPAGASGRVGVVSEPPGTARRVLIVDDEPDIVFLLSALVEDAGWKALPACGPDEALRRAAAEPIDLVLCDICMPGMDGIELLGELRARRLIGDAPVVLMSAARRAAPADVTFLAKPFDLDEVVALLDRLVAG
jgi:CheY-like chemotaxis protein